MASEPVKRKVLSAVDNYELGSASDEAVAGWAIQISDGGSAAGLSFKPQRRLTRGITSTWVDCAYKDMAASEALVAAGTAMTTVPQVIYVHGDGWDIRIALTAITGGSIVIEANPRLG